MRLSSSVSWPTRPGLCSLGQTPAALLPRPDKNSHAFRKILTLFREKSDLAPEPVITQEDLAPPALPSLKCCLGTA